jgi:copper chaperone CopZ
MSPIRWEGLGVNLWALSQAGEEPLMSSTAAPRSSVELEVTGMHCGSCVALIEETLGGKQGVEAITVTLEPPRASVTFEPSTVALDELVATIRELGYTASPASEPTGST